MKVINLAKVPKHLIETIKLILEKPGIYKMKDKDKNIMSRWGRYENNSNG